MSNRGYYDIFGGLLMNWETVEINKPRRRTEAFASVGRNSITLSGGACQLIDGYPKYTYAQILRATDNGKRVIGIRFCLENESNSLRINKRKVNSEVVAYSGSLNSKPVMEELFGLIGTQNKVTTYPITLDPDEKNVLIIHLEK